MKASLNISHLSKKFKDRNISVATNSNIGHFYLNSGGLHLNNNGLGRLAINLTLTTRKLSCELEPVNDDYDKEVSDENTSNLQSQKNLACEFSNLDKVATEEEEKVKSSLGVLKLRNVKSLNFWSN